MRPVATSGWSYRRFWDDGSFIFVGVLVDNCLILPSGENTLNWFIKEYKKHYTITGGEPVKKFNGVQIYTEEGKISFNQETYISQVYKKYLNNLAKPRSAPVEPGAEGAKKVRMSPPWAFAARTSGAIAALGSSGG